MKAHKRRPGRVVNKGELAVIFGVSPQAVDQWLARGCPVLEKIPPGPGKPGGEYRLDTAAVAEWRLQEAMAGALLKRPAEKTDAAVNRKTTAEASLAELKLGRELAQLITVRDWQRAHDALVATVRGRLLGVASKLAPLLAGADVRRAQDLVEREIHSALAELADAGVEESPFRPEELAGDDEPVAGVIAAAAEAVG